MSPTPRPPKERTRPPPHPDQGWRKVSVVLAVLVSVTVLTAIGRMETSTAEWFLASIAAGYVGINFVTRRLGQ